MSAPLRPGYKQTDVGVIPEDWTVRPVGEMGDVRAGKALAAWGPGDQRPYLRTKNVFDGRIIIDDVLRMPMTDADFSRYRLRYGDILLNEGQSIELVGRCSMYRDEFSEPCAIQNQLVRFRANDGVSEGFCSQLFRNCQQTGVFAKIALQTTSVAHLGVSRFHQLQLAWPREEAEQNAIAEALSDADSLIECIEQLIAKQCDLKQATVQQLLTGRSRLPGFSGEWRMRRVDEAGEILAGKALDIKGQGQLRPYLRTKNVLDGRIDLDDVLEMPLTDVEFERFLVMNGDLLLNEGQSLELVGRCSMYRGEFSSPCAMQNQLLRFRARKQTSPAFAEHLFRRCQHTGIFSAIATQTTSVAHLGSVRFCSLRLPWPSDLEEQTAIAAILSDMDEQIAALEKRLEKTRVLKQGMMQELLTGRIRLV